jgi:hypothetical protein
LVKRRTAGQGETAAVGILGARRRTLYWFESTTVIDDLDCALATVDLDLHLIGVGGCLSSPR